ncbi:glycosyltransferase [Rhizobium sp. 1399]|uniref:glycosyltransferase n=1 Tax=Rhizobium sp. 1399 TaxID=2817758 RepID=UPI00285FDE97|nr:glycosyltransferase [Rhizobium sp. 1399]MDR6671374.1 glycosyltransferase involved in cell wall biosynthesis [Rhizobium sp. 1399]
MNAAHNLRRLKVLRVVTTAECVPWHLGRPLKDLSQEFDITVAGNEVSQYAHDFPKVSWFDFKIARRGGLLIDAVALMRLFILCRRLKPDIAHSIMPKSGLLTAIAGSLAGVPVRMHTFTGQVWDTQKGVRRTILKTLDKLVIWLNTICLTDSPSQSRHLYEEGITLKGKPLPVLGQGALVGADLERFDPERIRRQSAITREGLAISQGDFVVAYIARKTRDKGAFDMLEGFANAQRSSPQLKLLFIGPDESNGELSKLKFEKPELFRGVIELDRVNNHEEYLNISDLLCVPSYREGFGSVVIDAAALGVPSIGSRIKGLVDSISDGETGLLFSPGNVQEIGDLISQMNSRPALLRKLGDEAKSRARKNFSSQVLGTLLKDFYNTQFQATKKH